MELTLFPDADAAYITIRESTYEGTHHLDGATLVDLDTNGAPTSIQFLNVTDGVAQQHIPGLTDQENQEVFDLLQEAGIEVTTQP